MAEKKNPIQVPITKNPIQAPITFESEEILHAWHKQMNAMEDKKERMKGSQQFNFVCLLTVIGVVLFVLL